MAARGSGRVRRARAARRRGHLAARGTAGEISLNHAIDILEPGLANTIQDGGRTGYRSIGVPVSGAADPVLLACANRLVGNEADAAAIEMPVTGPCLQATAEPVRVALMGAVDARLVRADGQTSTIASAHTVTLRRGDSLRVGAVRTGVAYLAISGACRVPAVLGSRSTYVRAGLGGVHGRALARGDRIECGPPTGNADVEWSAATFAHDAGPIRVVLGPQEDAFTPESVATFLAATYRVSRDSDRMGMRLDGPALAHYRGADVTSEGVVPGSIQVPGNGLPIVLLADAQTVGGYAKIATVIRADLARLAHRRPGSEIAFAAVPRAQAHEARRGQALALQRWAEGIVPYRAPGAVDLDRLRECNLVSGTIDARGDELPWEWSR